MPNDTSSHAAPITVGEAIAAIERKVAAARVRTQPFPHLVIDDVLPTSVRAAIDRHWPDAGRLSVSNHLHRGEIQVARLAGTADEPERRFWSGIRHLAAGTNRAVRKRLDRHLREKFRPLLGAGWRRALGDVSYRDDDAMLAHYTGTLDMNPHIDNARIVINCFVYLDDAAQPTPEPRRGTMLYRSLGFAWPTNYPIPAKMREYFLREDREIGWRDNRLLAYVNGPSSFHGVPKHELGASRRRLLMFGTLLDPATAERVLDPKIR